MFTAFVVDVVEHGVVTLVQVVLPVHLPGRLAAVVVLGALLGVSFLVGGVWWADQRLFGGFYG